MTIPELPTDNMYKFLALAGVFMVVSSLFIETNFQNDTITKLDNVDTNLSVDLMRKQYLEKQAADLKNETKGSNINEKKQKIDASLEDLREKIIRDGDSAEMKSLIVNDWLLLIQTMVVNFSGFFTAVYGFKNWYHRYQKYQDLMLMAEADKYNKHQKNKNKNVTTVERK